jgi:hypothetical protein
MVDFPEFSHCIMQGTTFRVEVLHESHVQETRSHAESKETKTDKEITDAGRAQEIKVLNNFGFYAGTDSLLRPEHV